MGKRHRQNRQKAKALAARLGFRETELGELKQRLSKTAARRRFLYSYCLRQLAEQEIVAAMSRRALKDIQDIEDAAFLESMGQMIVTLQAESPPPC